MRVHATTRVAAARVSVSWSVSFKQARDGLKTLSRRPPQPNMDIRLHILATPAQREEVLREFWRPFFPLPERNPLSECYIDPSCQNVRELPAQPHLGRFRESVLDEYKEEADEVGGTHIQSSPHSWRRHFGAMIWRIELPALPAG